MNIISTIFTYLLLAFVFFVAVGIFIQTSKEMWDNFLEDYGDWFKTTTVGMWYFNRKNGVSVISERKYRNLCATKNIVDIDVEE